jgi:hypothetical protein
MSLSITVTAGKRFTSTELVDNAKLNQMAVPTATLSGSADTNQIGNDSVTAAKAAFGAWFYCTASGTNTITLTATGHSITLTEGMIARFKVAADNTGAVDITFGGSTKDLFRYYNSTTSAGVELAAGDLRAGQQVEIIYDGTRWQLLSALGSMPVIVGTDAGSTDAYAITPSPSVRAYADITGIPVVFKANTINTGAATLEVSGLGSAKSIVKSYNVALSDGDIKAGQWVTVVYDGTNFQLQSPVTSASPALVRGTQRGVTLKNKSGAASTFDVVFTTGEVVLKNASGLTQLAAGSSVTAIDIDGGTGTGKRDTGTAAVGWWYVYLVGNGTAVSGCISTSSTGPDFTNMSGYSYYALIGAVYCSATGSPSTMSTVHQVDNVAYIATTASSSTANTATVWTQVAGVSTLIPPIAQEVFGTAGGSTAFDGLVSLAGNSTGTLGLQTVAGRNGAPTISSFYWGGSYRVPLPTAQTFYYMTDAAGTYRITISGYTI